MSTTYTLTPGKYVITDACQALNDYYDDVLLPEFIEFGRGENCQVESTVIACSGSDGGGYVRTTDGEIVGEFGMDAANVSILPYEMTKPVDPHYGTVVEFDTEFTVVVYHDAMVIGDRYRVRY